MLIHIYPKKISYFGGGEGASAGAYTNDGFVGNALATGNGSTAYQLSCDVVTENPNGVRIVATNSSSNSQSAIANCFGIGDIRNYFAKNNRTGRSEWRVGEGYTEIVKAGITAGGNGGDMICFGVHDDNNYQIVYNFDYGLTASYLQLAWPREKIVTRLSNTEGSTSGSYTQLAQGYFTGPPTYKTTGSVYGFKIKDKTSLEFTNYVTDITITVAEPHITQKSKPANFRWVAGGVEPSGQVRTRAKEMAIGYYDFRGDFSPNFGYHPNYRKLINSIKLNMSTSYEEFTLNGNSYPVPLSIRTVTSPAGSATYKDIAGTPSTAQGFVWHFPSSTTTIGWKNTNTGDDDEEDEPWPIIDTEKTVSSKEVWTTTFGGDVNRVGIDQRPVFTAVRDDDGAYYLSTTMGKYEVGYGYFASGYKTSTRNNYPFATRIVTGSGSMTNYGSLDYILTEYKEFGSIKRKHETSKRGYYFTDPETLYKNATEVGTRFDINTYPCYDATCIDVKLYANKNAFQTAKTYNNSAVLVTRKAPRNTIRGVSDTLTLQGVQSFSTHQTEETRIWDTRYDSTPIWGHPKYKKNEYGEEATYSFKGFKETTIDQSQTRLIPIGDTFFAGIGAYWYDSPAYRSFYNSYQGRL